MLSLRPTGAVIGVAVCLASPAAHAEDEPPRPVRVLHVPTATLQPGGVVFGTIGADPARGTPFVAVSAGLGGIAEVNVTLHDSLRMCASCVGDDRDTHRAVLATALFKVGLDAGTLGRHQPAVALGYRRSLVGQSKSPGPVSFEPELARLYLAIGWAIGTLDVTVGGDVWDARATPGGTALSDHPLSDAARPFAGISWRPPNTPRTTILLDWGWQPELRADGPELVGIGGLGVRYQATSWGSAELAVRVGTGHDLDLGAVVRFNGVFDARQLWR